MKNNITFLLGLVTSAAMVACYPPPPPPQPTNPVPAADENENPEVDPTDEGLDANAQNELNELRENAGIQPTDPNRTTETNNSGNGGTITETLPNNNGNNAVNNNNAVVPPRDGPKNYPFATPVPNRPGFVFNPFNQKKVDVRGLPSGTLVSDPRDPNQKFYVP